MDWLATTQQASLIRRSRICAYDAELYAVGSCVYKIISFGLHTSSIETFRVRVLSSMLPIIIVRISNGYSTKQLSNCAVVYGTFIHYNL